MEPTCKRIVNKPLKGFFSRETSPPSGRTDIKGGVLFLSCLAQDQCVAVHGDILQLCKSGHIIVVFYD